jgi:hypothetical protein
MLLRALTGWIVAFSSLMSGASVCEDAQLGCAHARFGAVQKYLYRHTGMLAEPSVLLYRDAGASAWCWFQLVI